MQARCLNIECEHWNKVTEKSKYCSSCGLLFSCLGVDIANMIQRQKESVTKIYNLEDKIFMVLVIPLLPLFVLTIFTHSSPFFMLNYTLIGMLISILYPALIYAPKIRRNFPEIYNNPNWKPD